MDWMPVSLPYTAVTVQFKGMCQDILTHRKFFFKNNISEVCGEEGSEGERDKNWFSIC